METITQTLINELDKARATMQVIVNQINPEQPIYSPWKLKEVLDHISGWDDAVMTSIRSFVLGEAPYTPALEGIDSYNQYWVASREAIHLDQSLQEWQSNREMLKQILAKVPAEKHGIAFQLPWQEQATIEAMVQVLIHHENHHAEEIGELIGELNSK